MRPSWRVVLPLCGSLLLLLPAAARAEIAIGESIDWVIADSDHVCVGKIARVEKVAGKDGKDYEVATVEVSRTLKGKARARVTVVLRNYNGPVAAEWKAASSPMLFCLVAPQRARERRLPGKAEWVLRDDGNDHCAVLLGKGKGRATCTIRVLTRDFEVLTEPAAILKRVERAVRSAAKAPNAKSHTLPVPSNTAVYRKLWSRSAVLLTVPIDEELQALGRRWCKSRSAYEREGGAKILGHYKNAENIKFLKALLNDPEHSTWEEAVTVPRQQELVLVMRKKWYYVRQAAYDALRRLGVKVERPVLEKVLEGKS
jgi:ribosomal protein S28E/S33